VSTPRSRLAALMISATLCMWTVTSVAHAGPAGTPSQRQSGSREHPDAAGLKNPVRPTPASIAAGQKLYEKQCVACHGATGKGDGKMAGEMNPKPADLSDASWKHGSSDGEIFTVIKDGAKDTGMRGFASKMTVEEIWNVVNYVRSLSKP